MYKYLSLLIFLVGCEFGIYQPVSIVNTFTKKIETKELLFFQDHKPPYKTGKMFFAGNLDFAKKFNYETWMKNEQIGPILHLKAYYKNCLLFSYSREELLTMKEKFGFKSDNFEVVYLIEKDGLRVVSDKEYEKIKHTFKSHNPPRSEVCKPE